MTSSGFIPERFLYLRISPVWERVGEVREFCATFLAGNGKPDIADRVALVVHELLENAVKYGTASRDIVLEVKLTRVGLDFEVHVSNVAVRSRLTLFEREVTRLNAMAPDEAYVDAIKRTHSHLVHRSGIGLARVRAEARVDIAYDIDGDELTVIAKPISGGPRRQ